MTEFRARVSSREQVAERVVELTIQRDDGSHMPPWAPGAHVDLVLSGGVTRQYSLIGGGDVPDSFRVAVLLEEGGRGGSKFVHEHLFPGSSVIVGGLRNNFRLVSAPRYLFIAGGIGITALLPMLATVSRSGADWRLIYVGRTSESMAYRNVLAEWASHITVLPRSVSGGLDLSELFDGPRLDTAVYCCGPERLMNGISDAMREWPAKSLHIERFAPIDLSTLRDDALESFEVELRRSGVTLHVPANKSIVDVCDDEGIPIYASCREGTCGSCETLVLEGVPAHRDSILDPEDRAAGRYIMPCVSRSCSPVLVLDL